LPKSVKGVDWKVKRFERAQRERKPDLFQPGIYFLVNLLAEKLKRMIALFFYFTISRSLNQEKGMQAGVSIKPYRKTKAL
jgi:hypothetical protein